MNSDALPFLVAILAIAVFFVAGSCAERSTKDAQSVEQCAAIEDPEVAKACFDAVGKD